MLLHFTTILRALSESLVIDSHGRSELCQIKHRVRFTNFTQDRSSYSNPGIVSYALITCLNTSPIHRRENQRTAHREFHWGFTPAIVHDPPSFHNMSFNPWKSPIRMGTSFCLGRGYDVLPSRSVLLYHSLCKTIWDNSNDRHPILHFNDLVYSFREHPFFCSNRFYVFYCNFSIQKSLTSVQNLNDTSPHTKNTFFFTFNISLSRLFSLYPLLFFSSFFRKSKIFQ